jgi:quercetin dioxygenase-like cupin family protein
MSFVSEPTEPGPVVGLDDGVEHVFVFRLAMPSETTVGLHIHEGDEIIRVLDGEVEFVLDGQRRRCGVGTIAVVPPRTEHGFVVRRDTTVEVIGEQHMGEFVTVVHPDGTRGRTEVHTEGMPWVRIPSDGRYHTVAELFDLMASTLSEVRGTPPT